MGVSEMLVACSSCGIIFSLTAAQPLIIVGATGPMLVFEEGLFQVNHHYCIFKQNAIDKIFNFIVNFPSVDIFFSYGA